MVQKNEKRSFFNSFLWYASGLNIRDLAGHMNSKSNYFGIGGVNLFTSILMFAISSWSFHIAFPKVFFIFYFIFGLASSMLIFYFSRQTISALSIVDNNDKKSNHSFLTILPIILFSLFIGVIISTPLKFYLFDMSISNNFLERISTLDIYTSSSISAKISSWSVSMVVMLIILLPTLMKLYMLPSHFQRTRSTIINELMWFCAGANKEILRKCPNDYSKFFGIGGTILFTALMASLSGGYAFYTAFENASLAIIFGIFWGCMIFNLDRFIVNTMYSDGKHSISRQEFVGGLPRIIIAVFLGIVISYPLELKLFEDEINNKMIDIHNTNISKVDAVRNINYAEITKKRNRANILQSEVAKKGIEVQKLYDEYIEEGAVGVSGRPSGKGEFYEEKKRRYEEVKADYDLLKATNLNNITLIDDEIRGLESQKQNDKNKDKAILEASKDFSARMEAFSLLKNDEGKGIISIASWFIMCLLVIIEICPVLFKMMIASGEYDDILNAERNETKIKELVRISQRNDWANTEIAKMIEENKKSIAEKKDELAAELKANNELLNSIACAQAEIAKVAIEKWKEEQVKKANDDPSSFIKTTENSKVI